MERHEIYDYVLLSELLIDFCKQNSIPVDNEDVKDVVSCLPPQVIVEYLDDLGFYIHPEPDGVTIISRRINNDSLFTRKKARLFWSHMEKLTND